MSIDLTRRQILGSAVASTLLPYCGAFADEPAKPGAFRFVHMTDIHIKRELKA